MMARGQIRPVSARTRSGMPRDPVAGDIGAPGDPRVDRALEELEFHCKELRILGSYPMARKRGQLAD